MRGVSIKGAWDCIPRFFVFLLVFIVLTIMSPSSLSALTLSDVYGTTPHAEDIIWLAENGITTGYKDGTFKPMAPVRRQDMAAFLYRLAGSPKYEPTQSEMRVFPDVDSNTDHAREIWWLAANGITTGYPDNPFRGLDTVKRQDMAAFLHRLDNLLNENNAASDIANAISFPDVNSSTPHQEDILWLAQNGISKGYPDGRFRPMETVYRQDMAAFLHRLSNHISGESGQAMISWVAVPMIILHAKPQNDSPVTTLPYHTELTYFGKVTSSSKGSWNRVGHQGKTYYFWSPSSEGPMITFQKPLRSYPVSTEIQGKLVAKALDVLDNWKTTYVQGAVNDILPGDVHAFDCSGYASYILNSVMQDYVPVYDASSNLKRLRNDKVLYNLGFAGEFAATNVWSKGETLDLGKVKPGDLLFFQLANEGSSQSGVDCNHVGMYLGNGEFIHCTHTWNRVVIMPVDGIYREGLVAIRRYVPDSPAPANKQMKTTSNVTKLRSSMNSTNDDNVVEVLGKGESVTVRYVSRNYQNPSIPGNWALVESDGLTGYILLKYLE